MEDRKKKNVPIVPQQISQMTNVHIIVIGFQSLEETILECLSKYIENKDHQGLTTLYVEARKQIEALQDLLKKRLSVCPVFPELPLLVDKNYEATIKDLANHCYKVKKLLMKKYQHSQDSDLFISVKELRESFEPPWDSGTWTKVKKANPWIRFELKAPKNRPRIHWKDADHLKRGPLHLDTFELLDVQGDDLPSIAEIAHKYVAESMARAKKEAGKHLQVPDESA